jgi:hypothetical protein
MLQCRLGGAPALATMDAKLYCLEREMDILARLQGSVAKERDELYYARQRAHNAQLAINRLPEEILCVIFMEIGASVGHICDLWRQITLNMPQLWRDIHLTITPNDPAPSEMVSTWIQRSRSVLLDFTVDLLRSAFHANIPFFKEHLPLCRSLTITYNRWDIHADVRADVSDWSFLLSAPMPLLRSLDLDVPGVHPGDSSPELVIALASFPRLRSLCVSTGVHAPSISFGEFFSPYLTAITLSILLPISELSRLTAGSPVLRSLTLMCTNHPINNDDNLTITLPPSTIELTLIGEWALFYLAKFIGPNVHTLSLSPFVNGSDTMILLPDPTERFPTLRKYAHQSHCTVPQLSTFIGHPCVEELEIEVLAFRDMSLWVSMCGNIRSITVYDESCARDAWKTAQEGAHTLLLKGHSSMKIFFICYIQMDSWSLATLDMCREFPDKFFPTLGPVPPLTVVRPS